MYFSKIDKLSHTKNIIPLNIKRQSVARSVKCMVLKEKSYNCRFKFLESI